MKFLQIALGYIVGRAIIVHVLLPLYFRGQLLTAYEVLDERFGGLTRAGGVAAVSGRPQPGRRPAAVSGGDRAAEAGPSCRSSASVVRDGRRHDGLYVRSAACGR